MLVEAIEGEGDWGLLSWIRDLSAATSGSSCLIQGSVKVGHGVKKSQSLEDDSREALEAVPSVITIRNLVDNHGSKSSEKERSVKEKAGNGSRQSYTLCSFVPRKTSTSYLAKSSKYVAVEPETLVRHLSNVGDSEMLEFFPTIRSGGWTDIGARQNMEDAHACIDNLSGEFGQSFSGLSAIAFYGVFDGHGGHNAANFAQENLLKFIVDDVDFPSAIPEAVRHAYLETDHAFAEACRLDQDLSSGTTALTVLIIGRQLLVANAGDCRAVLCRRGKAIEMSRDHKAECVLERTRIEALGGFVDDGYLNGQLSVARALGDWHLTGMKEHGAESLLTAEPEIQENLLTEEDEFLILGCDGLWDVFTSQNAVDFARRKLQQHNDPEICSKELVAEALRRDTCDNLTVVTVCLHPGPPPRLGSIPASVGRIISSEGLHCLQNILNGCL